MMDTTNLVEVKELKKYYAIRSGILRRVTGNVKAVDHVSMNIESGKTCGLVGESGSGKSTFARTIIRLEELTSGKIFFDNEDITSISGSHLRSIRKRIQIVFQDPFSSLNPRMSILNIIGRPMKINNIPKDERKKRVGKLLGTVGLRREYMYRYPHEFSGGQRQRIAIARALSVEPKFLVLDEPTSALDVSVQAQILNLLKDLQEKLKLTYLFISHNLALVRFMSNTLFIMYSGKILESGPTKDIFDDPKHPYTKAMLSSILTIDKLNTTKKIVLKGEVPSPSNPPPGCRFQPRCPDAFDRCSKEEPRLFDLGNKRFSACFLTEE